MMVDLKKYKETILSFKGPLSIDVIVYLTNYLRHVLRFSPQTFMKIYKIFIELTQNISFYSADVHRPDEKTSEGIGEFLFVETETAYRLIAKNIVYYKDGVVLKEKCDYINSLNHDEIRDLKRKTRGQSDIHEKGAHIGLMHMSLLSKNKLICNIFEVDNEFSFFELTILIDKTDDSTILDRNF